MPALPGDVELVLVAGGYSNGSVRGRKGSSLTIPLLEVAGLLIVVEDFEELGAENGLKGRKKGMNLL